MIIVKLNKLCLVLVQIEMLMKEIKNTVQYLMDTKEMHKYDKKWNIAENIICNKYGIYEKCNVSVKDRVINWYYDSIFMYNMRKIWHRLFS